MNKKLVLYGAFFTGIMIASIIFLIQPIKAAAPAGYSEFFIPGGDEQLWDILVDLDDYDPNTVDYKLDAAAGMHAIISIVAAADSTTIYYDHWEDGYGFDPNDPVNTADEIIYLDEGEVKYFETSHIPIDPRGTGLNECGDGNDTCYDGRDRFYAQGGSVTVSRAGWAESSGASTLYAVAWEVFPTKPWMTEYTIPVGEDMFTSGYEDFHKTYIIVEATNDGTEVTFDDPVNGITGPVSLNTGEVTQLYHFDAGTKVKATAPIQVQFIVGRNWQQSGQPARHYEVRGFTAVPEELWDNEYVVPVRSFDDNYGQGDLDEHNNSDVYLYNPSHVDLTVTWEDSTGTGSFIIGPGETRAYSNGTGHVLPQDSGAYLHGSTLFWGIGTVDSESTDYDWGYSLIPVSSLRDEYTIGWAPSTLNKNAQGSPLFISSVNDRTTVYVDYSPIDGVFDDDYTIDRLDVLKIFDDTDYDLTGSHIWSTGPIAIVWGEDPDTAGASYNFLDMGYTTLPLLESSIDLVLGIQKTVDPPVISPGANQQVEFTLVVSSRDYQVNDVNVNDTLPEYWSYVSGSASVTLPDGSSLDEAGANFSAVGQLLTWGLNLDMNPNESLTIVFKAETTAVLPECYSLNLAEATGVRSGQTFRASDQAFIYVSDLRMDKTSSADGNVVYPNDTIQYTIVISNVGLVDAADISLTDVIPEGTTYVANSALVTAPAVSSGYVLDDFSTVSYSNNNGTANWLGSWYEIGESDGPSAGSVRVRYGRLRLDDHNDHRPYPGAWRQVNLSGASSATLSFSYQASNASSTDSAVVQVSNDGSSWSTLYTFSGTSSGTRTRDISSFISSQTSVRFQITQNYGGSDEYFYVDNVRIDFEGSGTGYSTVSGNEPPYIVEAGDNYTLSPGETMTVTFQVTVDEPPLVSQIVNTAHVYSPGMCAPLSDTTRDPLGPMDYGDLPVGYRATRIEYDGARHAIGTLYLGSSVDDEGNGQADAAALGDDMNDINDDDGVIRDFNDLWTPGSQVDLFVTITGGSGYLAGWFDWNGDGEFGSGEMVDFGSLTEGAHTVTVDIPNNGTYITGDALFARFRLYPTDPGTPVPTGYSVNGEVEDYRWEFNTPTAVTIKDMHVSSPVGSFWSSAWMMAAALLVSLLVLSMRHIKQVNNCRTKPGVIKVSQNVREIDILETGYFKKYIDLDRID